MRRDPTFAEKQLWKALRQLEPFHFRRQAPMGAYVVDFVCHQARLIVEVDGGAHLAPDVAARDAAREAWLAGRGYRVVRIANSQAIHDPDAAIAVILAAAGSDTPTPNPSPQGGGEFESRRSP
jgi:very-short-patch-repair endonuclease